MIRRPKLGRVPPVRWTPASEISARILASEPMVPVVFHTPAKGPAWRRLVARITAGRLCSRAHERYVWVDDDGEVHVARTRPGGVEVRGWDDDD